MQREQCCLQRQPHHHKDKGGLHGPGPGQRRHPLRQVGDIERTGHLVQQPDADQEEGRPDRAKDEVIEGCRQGPPVRSQTYQHIGRQRRHLEEHKDVEGIAGNRHAEQSGQAQKITRIEKVFLFSPDFAIHTRLRIGHHQRADGRHNQQDIGIDQIDPELDAPGRRPAAELVTDGTALDNGLQQQPGNHERDPAYRQRKAIGEAATPQQDANRRRQQRHDNLQCGKMRHHRAFSSSFSMSSSSMEP